VNIINEKIYIFLWYWFIILIIITGIYWIYRLLTIFSSAVRKAVLGWHTNGLVDSDTIEKVTNYLTVAEWFFLSQLGANLDPYFFKRLMEEILQQETKTNNGIPRLELKPSPEEEQVMAQKERIDKQA